MEAVEQFWLQHSLGGDDSLAVEPAVEALQELYQLSSLPLPDYVLVLDSPLAAAVAWRAVQLFSEPLRASPPQPPALTWRLHHLVEELVRGPISRRLVHGDNGLVDGVWDLLEGYLPWTRGLRRLLHPRTYGPLGPVVPFQRLGCGNPGWLAHGESLVSPDNNWQAVHALAISGVWDCLLTFRCSILVRRPTEVRRDAEGRLHSLSGPAFLWSDGFRGYAIHGVEVPPWVINHPERITPEFIWETPNVEVRRVLIDRFGRERFVLESGATPVHEDRDGANMPRRLLRLPGEACYVEVKCPSTGHEHLLCVPPTVRTCHEAVAWTFGKTPADYAPLVEA